ncbi:ABC transporter permease [Alicyclobacillus fodiniaquatilis]|uniref:ABC transporter permease n=1 Tax=Alicyclobacillus fodiniaquatilis TaxID=1661150 RepID=A0ABW4JMX2_9BACL
MSARGLAKRIGVLLLTVIATMIITFLLLRMMPGNIVGNLARTYASTYAVPIDQAYQIIAGMIHYNPKQPIDQQFYTYIKGILHGNLGQSIINTNVSVDQVIGRALPWTVFTLSISLVVSFLIGINLGSIMAWKRKSILDPIISTYAILSTAVPSFIIAILLLVFFAFQLAWFPVQGAYGAQETPGFNIPFMLSALYHAVLPIITYIIASLGGWALSMKGNAVNILGEDYITAAYIRGVPDSNIMKNYVKKNALLPLVTSLALQFGMMIGGSTIIESYFSYPGMGYYIGQATSNRDYPEMQGLFLVTAVAVMIANLIADLLYTKLDPRVKLED